MSTTVGGIVESKQIGLQVELLGTHNNTEVVNGVLRLKPIRYDGLGNPIYAEYGEWISDAIDLKDKFLDYDKLFTNNIVNGNSSFRVQTRVSNDNYNWDNWIDIDYTNGMIYSETKQFIQVKIIFEAGFVTDNFIISEFDNTDENFVNEFDNKEFIETVNGLKLKREYEYDMSLDTTWSEEGSLHRKKITRDDWVRIDKMNVLRKQGDIWNRELYSSPIFSYTGSTKDYNLGIGLESTTASVTFKFKGIKLRILANTRNNYRSTNTQVKIDGVVVGTISSLKTSSGSNGVDYDIVYEKEFEDNKERTVTLTALDGASNKTMYFQGIEYVSTEAKTLILHDGEYKNLKHGKEELNERYLLNMTSNTTPSPFMISASSVHSTTNLTYPSWRAFDGIYDISTAQDTQFWSNAENSFPCWLSIDFGEKRKVNYLHVYHVTDGSQTARIKNFVIQGSDNGNSWINLKSFNNEVWANYTNKKFYLDDVAEYRYYRLYITENNGFTRTTIAELVYGVEQEYIEDGFHVISSSLPTQEQFLSDGMDSLSPLLDRRVEKLEPLSMNKSEIFIEGEEDKVFSKTIDLKKCLDIRSIKVEVK